MTRFRSEWCPGVFDVSGLDHPRIGSVRAPPLDLVDELSACSDPELVVSPVAEPARCRHADRRVAGDVPVLQLDVAVVVGAEQTDVYGRCDSLTLTGVVSVFGDRDVFEPRVVRARVAPSGELPIRGRQRVGGRRKGGLSLIDILPVGGP